MLLSSVEGRSARPKRAIALRRDALLEAGDDLALRAAVHQWLAANVADATIRDSERHALESLELAERGRRRRLARRSVGGSRRSSLRGRRAGRGRARRGGARARGHARRVTADLEVRCRAPPGVVVRPPRPGGELHPRRDPHGCRPPGQGGRAHGRPRARAGSAGRASRVQGSLDARELGDPGRPLGSRRRAPATRAGGNGAVRGRRVAQPRHPARRSSPSIAARSGMPASSWPAVASWPSGSRTHSLPSRPSSASRPA